MQNEKANQLLHEIVLYLKELADETEISVGRVEAMKPDYTKLISCEFRSSSRLILMH